MCSRQIELTRIRKINELNAKLNFSFFITLIKNFKKISILNNKITFKIKKIKLQEIFELKYPFHMRYN